jgi:tetratricopeptide (TPR) repeat protein
MSGATPRAWLAAVLLLGLTLAAYLPSLGNGFVWDDDVALTQNPMMKSDDGLRQFWLTTEPPDYWPMTATTLWVEWRMWGMEASGYHVTNLLLHLTEVFLLWRILLRLSIPGAWLGALLFAVHPVNVESVAWITQRKNLVAMLFYLLSIYGFLRWRTPAADSVRPTGARPDSAGFPIVWYGCSLLAFALAMLSKGSVAMLPLILVGLVLWRGRLGPRDLRTLSPYFAVAAGLTAVDVWFQSHHLVGGEVIRRADLGERLLGAAAAVGFYLSKAVFPLHLAFFYPLWQVRADEIRWWLPLLAGLGLTGGLAYLAWRRPAPPAATDRSLWRGALAAWGYFCVALIPVMGFTDVYFMKFSLVADHYQHVALIGVTTLGGAAWARWVGAASDRPGGSSLGWKHAVAAGVVVALAVLTWQQCRKYLDAETLFEQTLVENPRAWLAHEDLGVIQGHRRQYAEAMAHLETAARLNPDFADPHSNLGALLVDQGRIPEGVAEYEAALRINPNQFFAHLNLGSLLLFQGRLEEAGRELQTAVRLRPGSAEAHQVLARTFRLLGRRQEAVAECETALRLRPDFPEARAELALALQAPGGAPFP